MRRIWRPLTNLLRAARAARWTARGKRCLARGDARGAAAALERALDLRPEGFSALLHLSRTYLRCRDLFRAHRTLARAREADPRRFAAEAGMWVAREGFDLDTVCAGPQQPREPEPAVAGRRSRRRVDAGLDFGDCRDLDEYARFRAMPPISAAEVEETDWDALLGDLQDE
jgi:tetratricopeptide (TPR) repeat protein